MTKQNVFSRIFHLLPESFHHLVESGVVFDLQNIGTPCQGQSPEINEKQLIQKTSYSCFSVKKIHFSILKFLLDSLYIIVAGLRNYL